MTLNNFQILHKIQRINRFNDEEKYDVMDKFYYSSVINLVNKHKYIHIKKNYKVKYSLFLELNPPYQSTKIMIYDDGTTLFFDGESKKTVVSLQMIFTIESTGVMEGTKPYSGMGYMYYRRNVNPETQRYEGFNYAANWSTNIPDEVIYSEHYRYYLDSIKSRTDKIFKGYIKRNEDTIKEYSNGKPKITYGFTKPIFFNDSSSKNNNESNISSKEETINFISNQDDVDDYDFENIVFRKSGI